MKEDTEGINFHHVPEGKSPVLLLCLEQSCRECGDAADERNSAERALAAALVHHRIEQHHQHSKQGEHDFRQDSDVIHALRQPRQRLKCDHRATSLLANWVNGTSALWTAGSIAFNHSSGATPIASAITAAGHSAVRSRRFRSGNRLFSSCVTFPKNTRWYIQSK